MGNEIRKEKTPGRPDAPSETLAGRVLESGRTRILVKYRYLGRALYALRMAEKGEERRHVPPDGAASGNAHRTHEAAYASDGEVLAYDAAGVLRAYREDSFHPVRVWIHVVMHHLFRHPFVEKAVQRRAWDLASDIAAESMVLDLFPVEGESRKAGAVLRELESGIGLLTAERVYRMLLSEPPSPARFRELEKLFRIDDHGAWYRPDGRNDVTGRDESRADGGGRAFRRDEESPEEREAGESLPGNDAPNSYEKPGGSDGRRIEGNPVGGHPVRPHSADAPESARAKWERIERAIRTQLETVSRREADQAGSFLERLGALSEEEIDYRRFLTRFLSRCEVMETSQEEFDYVYYTYGLKLYGMVPLIEPLEYREDRRMRDLVIAIDTSGSVRGERVRAFLRKTCTILRQEGVFERRFRLHILQCDTAVQDDRLITSREGFDEYIQSLTLCGFGGTDFRAVFDYLGEEQRAGRMMPVRGLLYFTDGEGRYPERAPSYPAAFVFTRMEDARKADVPAWAIRAVLDDEGSSVL